MSTQMLPESLRARDEQWCRALTQVLDTRDIEAVTREFNNRQRDDSIHVSSPNVQADKLAEALAAIKAMGWALYDDNTGELLVITHNRPVAAKMAGTHWTALVNIGPVSALIRAAIEELKGAAK